MTGHLTTSGDIEACDSIATNELHVEGLTQLNSNLVAGRGVDVTGGRGRDNSGAQLRLVSDGDLVYNPPALVLGGHGQDLQILELSWLGCAHSMRATAANPWTQTMKVEYSGTWKFTQGAIIDGQLVVNSINFNGSDLAASLPLLLAWVEAPEARLAQ